MITEFYNHLKTLIISFSYQQQNIRVFFSQINFITKNLISMKNVTVNMSYKFSQNVLYKYYYRITSIVPWALGYYFFHPYFNNYPRVFYTFSFCLCICICFGSLGLTQRLSVQFLGTFLSSTEPLTSNHAVFICEHEVILKLWQDPIRSCIMRVLKYLLCISSTKWSFHLPWMFPACKREPL